MCGCDRVGLQQTVFGLWTSQVKWPSGTHWETRATGGPGVCWGSSALPVCFRVVLPLSLDGLLTHSPGFSYALSEET